MTDKKECEMCDRPARKGSDFCSDDCERDSREEEALDYEIFFGFDDD